jgi:hypothetical protein
MVPVWKQIHNNSITFKVIRKIIQSFCGEDYFDSYDTQQWVYTVACVLY